MTESSFYLCFRANKHTNGEREVLLMSNGFNPLQSLMQGFRAGEEIRQAPQRRQLADLTLQQQQLGLSRQQQAMRQAQTQAQREGTAFDQGQAIQRAKILNQSAKALKQIPMASRPQVFGQMVPRFQQFGIDLGDQQPDLSDAGLDGYVAQTEGFIRNPSQLTASMRERQQLLSDIKPFIDEKGAFDKSRADARALSAARELNIITKPGTQTKEERVAVDPELAEKIGKTQAAIKGAIEEEKIIAKARGENFNELRAAQAAMPNIEKVVGELKVLADDATFTLGGKAFNRFAKELGYSTSGDTARSSMIAIVDNQVLPLLRPIFGAAFTKAEGDSLKQALVNPDSTAESRKAQLNAFLTQMKRNIETKQAQEASTKRQPLQPEQQAQPVKRIRFDAQGNIIQ